MSLTRENYFSRENQLKYMGSSQFKAFMKCPAAALAEINGEHVREKTTALLVGSYVDAHFEGSLDLFRAQNPEIYTKGGDLKSEYRRAEDIIARIERDPMMMMYLSGKKQVIRTGEIEGVPFKIRIDSYHPGAAIVDQKIMRDFEDVWVPGQGRQSFIDAWGYDTQGAIYTAVEAQNSASGVQLPFILACATKEPTTDLALISIPQHKLDTSLEIIKALAPLFDDIKKGIIPPTRCESCDYCKKTKVLSRVVSYDEMFETEDMAI